MLSKLICSLFILCSAGKVVGLKYKFVSPGENVTLPCRSNNNSADWNGPAHDTNPSPIVVNDIYGNRMQWNVSKYSDNLKINPSLSHYYRLRIINETSIGMFDLQIRNVSTYDEGLYFCDVTDVYMSSQRYILQIKSSPSDLHIKHLSGPNTLTGMENQEINLTCTVKSGKPAESLTLITDGKVIKEGGQGFLVYSFIPTKEDDGTNYTCEARSPWYNVALSKTIQLSIKYRPALSFGVGPIKSLIEGRKEQLCCNTSGNPDVNVLSISKDDTELKTGHNESFLCYTFESVNRMDSGKYTCWASNEIGNATKDLTLIVLYPSIVQPVRQIQQFSVHDDQRILKCHEDGMPDNLRFSQWEHKSNFEEHIRYLDATDDGTLVLPEADEIYRYQDNGVYICNVSNGIPDRGGRYFQTGRIHVLSEGPPVFVAANSGIKYGELGRHFDMKVIVYSLSDIECQHIVESKTGTIPCDVRLIEQKNIITKDVFHDKMITVTGIELLFRFKKLTLNHLEHYNITVCNRYGNNSITVKLTEKHDVSDFNQKTSPTTAIFILCSIVLLVIVFVAYLAWKKCRNHTREKNNQGQEQDDKSPTYYEIDDSEIFDRQQSTSQRTNDEDFAHSTYCNSQNEVEGNRNFDDDAFHNIDNFGYEMAKPLEPNGKDFAHSTYYNSQNMVEGHRNFDDDAFHNIDNFGYEIAKPLELQESKSWSDSIVSCGDLESSFSDSICSDKPQIHSLLNVSNAYYDQSDDLQSLSDCSYALPYAPLPVPED